MARWSARHPWQAIALWAVFVAAAVLAGGAAGTRSATPADQWVGESGRASAMIESSDLRAPAVQSLLLTGGTLTTPAVVALTAQLRGLPEVASVEGPIPARDSNALLLSVTMAGDPATADARLAPVLAALDAALSAQPDLRIDRVSGPSIEEGIEQQLQHDLHRSEVISLPITLLILLVAFGAIVAAGVPVLLALTSVAGAIGLAGLASHVFPDTGTTTNMILLMGMAVGVDYSLFYLKREREERARGLSRLDAIEVAASTSGRSVVVSGLAVIVSMAGLYLANDVTFSSLATGSILVVAVAMLGSLTVLPAVLVKLGRAVDHPRLPFVRRPGGARLLPAIVRPALRHPAIALTLATAAMMALALPALGLKLKASTIADLPRSIPAVAAFDRLTAAFPDRLTSNDVVVRAPAPAADRVVAALSALGDRDSIRSSADGQVHLLAVPAAVADEDSLRTLRARAGQVLAAIPDAQYAVGGDTAGNLDYASHQAQKLPVVIGFVLLLTFLVMSLTFRSVVIALTAMVINLLSAAAAFGVLVLVFQHHWVLDFQTTGAVVAWIPLFLFVVLFGLSMDYHVFVVSRIREAARGGRSTREAVAAGVLDSGAVVTSAAVVMVAIFGVFATLSMIEFKEIGVGLATAVALDAFVVRVVILPAIMSLLGGRTGGRAGSAPRPAGPNRCRRRRHRCSPSTRGERSGSTLRSPYAFG